MTILTDLFKWCLEHFYPRNNHTVDDVYYPSKEEVYSERLESLYLNGSWYIHDENTPVVAKIVERRVKPVYYLIESDGKYGFAFPTSGFVNNQKIEVDVTYDNDSVNHYTMSLFDSNSDYMYCIFNSEITYENINKITISFDTVITDHVKYLGLEEDIILDNVFNDCIVISRKDFTDIKNNPDIVLQRIHPEVKARWRKVNYAKYELQIRNILPNPNYYNENQIIQINNGNKIYYKENSSPYIIIEFNKVPALNITVHIKLYKKQEFTGFEADLFFEEVNETYTKVSNITYI